jgi:NSS family neurotransmitter:Na+ symporter
VDYFINGYTLILTGILEVIVIGWCFKTSKVLDEVNRNTVKFRMPMWWFNTSIKYIAPVVLSALFIWNLVTLILGGGLYGAADGYSLASNIIGGWLVMALSVVSGFIIKLVVRAKAKKGFVEDDVTWDSVKE